MNKCHYKIVNYLLLLRKYLNFKKGSFFYFIRGHSPLKSVKSTYMNITFTSYANVYTLKQYYSSYFDMIKQIYYNLT